MKIKVENYFLVTQRLHDERLLLERIADRKKPPTSETDAVAARPKSGTS